MSVLAILGAGVWAYLTVRHALIIYIAGWPDIALARLIMAFPAVALVVHVALLWWVHPRRTYIGSALAALSLLSGAGMLALEVTMHFSGYE